MKEVEKIYSEYESFLEANKNIAISSERDYTINEDVVVFLFSRKENEKYDVDHVTLPKKYFFRFADIYTDRYYDKESILADRGIFYMSLEDNSISREKPEGEYILFYTSVYVYYALSHDESSEEFKIFAKGMKELGIDDVYSPHVIKDDVVYKFRPTFYGRQYYKTFKSETHISYSIVNERYVPIAKVSKEGKAHGFPYIYEDSERVIYNRKKKTLTHMRKTHGYKINDRIIVNVGDHKSAWMLDNFFKEPIESTSLEKTDSLIDQARYEFFQYLKPEFMYEPWQEKNSLIDLHIAKNYPAILMFPKQLIKDIYIREMTPLNKRAFKEAKSLKEFFEINELKPLTKRERVLLFSLEDRFKEIKQDYSSDISSVWFIYFTAVRPFAKTADEAHKMLELIIRAYSFDIPTFYAPEFKEEKGFIYALNSSRENKQIKKSAITNSIAVLKEFGVNNKAIQDAISWLILPTQSIMDKYRYKKLSDEQKTEYNELLKELNLYGQIVIDMDTVRKIDIDIIEDTVDMIKTTANALIKAEEELGREHGSVRMVSELFKDVLEDSTTIAELHDSMVDVINSDTNVFGEKDNKFVYTDKELELNRSYGDYSFELPDNTSVLTLIGKKLSICIGSESYAVGSLKRDFYLPVVKKRGEIVAVLEIRNSEKGLLLIQAKGYHNNINKPLDDEVQEVIINYVKDLRIVNRSFSDIPLYKKDMVVEEDEARVMQEDDINVQEYTANRFKLDSRNVNIF